MILDRHIIFIGLRASGKSSISRALARYLGVDAIDLDDRTRDALACTSVGTDRVETGSLSNDRVETEGVGAAFTRVGEAQFRAAEAAELQRALAQPAQVMALGGGTPTAPGARAMLEEARQMKRALIIFLDPPLELLAQRLMHDEGERPSLTGLGVVGEIEFVANARRPLYAALADLVLRDDVSVEALASMVSSHFRSASES